MRVARSRGRHAARAEAALAMSVGLGLRAKELAGLKWADVYADDGRVRAVVHLRAAYTKGGKTRDVFASSPALRRVLAKYGEARWLMSAASSQAPLFASQKGGAMTPGSMAKIPQGALRRGRYIGGVLAQRPADANHAARRARDRPEGDRRDRGPREHPHHGDVC